MEVIKTTRLQPNGDLSTEFQLTDHIRSEEEGKGVVKRKTIQQISSSEWGINHLAQISNSIHRILMEEAVEKQRDTIVGSQNYGFYHVLNHIVPRYLPNEFVNRDELIWWLSAILSNETTPDTTERYLKRKFYHHPQQDFNFLTLRKLINNFIRTEVSVNDETLIKKYFEKISAWCSIQNDPWLSTPETKILEFTKFVCTIRKAIVELTGFQWNIVQDILSELQVVHVDYSGVPVYVVSRTTSEMRTLFFMMDCPLPPVIAHIGNTVGVHLVENVPLVDMYHTKRSAA